ncbi:hypothetical protein OD350_29155 (plasmid) [Clostridium beijerinckii]|uniref:hypothetical protein n=1 Tax=Clostridium beijerinckii TaxID=1520 RepID=UPI002226FD36|nr:hypothetical protein [Clostridium beijerinckii]UYZ38958.1 hypothetical protein OD350_29155 [Clostridium beijerinckii]
MIPVMIISKNVKVSEKDIAVLSSKHTVISHVVTALGTDDTYIAEESIKIINNYY